jgi:hypothetical protein
LQDDGADIDTSAMLLPKPGMADDTAVSAAAVANDPDEAFADKLAEAGKVAPGFMNRASLAAYHHCLPCLRSQRLQYKMMVKGRRCLRALSFALIGIAQLEHCLQGRE